ncbi:heme NO-binding domain-containing protein [uncultured Roseovarius sp.]|uniref:heme NO-binding domain-containing protein n=1 Tax=uncultured Roseovarius sp. TaxID=293344 RepID=UPI0025914273|nr:heme NO-binding domain-containing protein [uncultured Roseovarius sp.]
MHGVINRAVERFVRDTYGRDVWLDIMRCLDLGFSEFEAMLSYDAQVTPRLLGAVADRLKKSRDEVLEDIGTYLVSHPNMAAVRRLLRFGGPTFQEFLHSLDDLPERTRLAIPELALPKLTLVDLGPDRFCLKVHNPQAVGVAFGYVVLGLLRALADDYGALVMLEHMGAAGHQETLGIHLLSAAHGEGRIFTLGKAAP